MRTSSVLGLVVCLVVQLVDLPGSGAAKADLVLRFGQADYVVAPGQGIDVPVYLSESGTTILATEGLNSAGLVLSFNLPPRVNDPAQVTLITPNPGVNDIDDFVWTSINPATGSTTGTAELLFSIVLSNVLFPSSDPSSILLGTFHFTAGAIPGEVTNLSVGIAPGGPQFLSGTGQELDPMIAAGDSSVRTLAVPEPRSIILLGSSAFCFAVYAWRRRRMVKT
jgi:hypothetical protein